MDKNQLNCCPLCNSNKNICLKSINVDDIISNYLNKYEINVNRYFSTINTISIIRCVNCDLVYFTPTCEGDDFLYSELAKQWWYYMEDKYEYEYAINKIIDTNPKTILDIGSGVGHFVDRFRYSFDTAVTEFSLDAIKVLKEKKVEFDNEFKKYDFITAFQVIEHIKSIRSFLDNIVFNKLNENGYFLITVPNPESEYNKEIMHILDYPPHHVTRWTQKSLFSIAKLYNLRIVEYFQEPIFNLHYYELLTNRLKIAKECVNNAGLILNSGVNLSYAISSEDMKSLVGHTHGVILQKRFG